MHSRRWGGRGWQDSPSVKATDAILRESGCHYTLKGLLCDLNASLDKVCAGRARICTPSGAGGHSGTNQQDVPAIRRTMKCVGTGAKREGGRLGTHTSLRKHGCRTTTNVWLCGNSEPVVLCGQTASSVRKEGENHTLLRVRSPFLGAAMLQRGNFVRRGGAGLCKLRQDRVATAQGGRLVSWGGAYR